MTPIHAHIAAFTATAIQNNFSVTYSLSEKIHERFYVVCHGVTLPHKFKTAVGRCPNNRVKPALSHLGEAVRLLYRMHLLDGGRLIFSGSASEQRWTRR